MSPSPIGRWRQLAVLRFCSRIEVDVDHVVEHADRCADQLQQVSSHRVPFLSYVLAKLIEPKLQTAVSSAEVLSKISVQRLELWTTPTWSCGERMLEGSLNVIQGWPVSKSMLSILRQSCSASTFLKSLIFPSLPFFHIRYSAFQKLCHRDRADQGHRLG